MGLFSRKTESNADSGEDREYRGGCSKCDMYGPSRKTINEANDDANGHSARMHKGRNPNGYIERRK